MKLVSLTSVFSAVLLGLCFVGECSANIVLYDSGGFEGFTAGNVVGQSGWAQENDGVFQVQSVVKQSGNNALSASVGTLDQVSSAGPGSLNFTPNPGQAVEIQADLARTLGTGTPSFSYAIDLVSPALNRIIRFGLRNVSGSIEGFYTARNPNSNLIENFLTNTGTTYNENEFVSFAAKLNFDSGTVDLFVNGNSVTGGSNIQFANATTTLGRVEFQINSNFDADDFGYLDNFSVLAAPEPSALLLVGLASCAVGIRRRR